jgi:uncharacterized protein (DUF2147 family)
MKYASLLIAATAILAAAPLPPQATPRAKAAAATRQPYEGVWRNARGTVQIETRRCGKGLCGKVVRAAPEADEAAGGGLVGTELFRNLERGDDGRWYGAVYVPDIGQEVEGSIAQTGPNQLSASGCLFAGFGCKEQLWTRVR